MFKPLISCECMVLRLLRHSVRSRTQMVRFSQYTYNYPDTLVDDFYADLYFTDRKCYDYLNASAHRSPMKSPKSITVDKGFVTLMTSGARGTTFARKPRGTQMMSSPFIPSTQPSSFTSRFGGKGSYISCSSSVWKIDHNGYNSHLLGTVIFATVIRNK